MAERGFDSGHPKKTPSWLVGAAFLCVISTLAFAFGVRALTATGSRYPRLSTGQLYQITVGKSGFSYLYLDHWHWVAYQALTIGFPILVLAAMAALWYALRKLRSQPRQFSQQI